MINAQRGENVSKGEDDDPERERSSGTGTVHYFIHKTIDGEVPHTAGPCIAALWIQSCAAYVTAYSWEIINHD